MRKATSSFGVSHDNQCCSKACMLVQDAAMFPLVKNMFNTATDPDKHWGEYIVNNVPSLAMYK